METGNLPKKDIRVMITKMIKKSGEKWIQNENLESFNKELEILRNNQTEMKNTVTENINQKESTE